MYFQLRQALIDLRVSAFVNASHAVLRLDPACLSPRAGKTRRSLSRTIRLVGLLVLWSETTGRTQKPDNEGCSRRRPFSSTALFVYVTWPLTMRLLRLLTAVLFYFLLWWW